MRSILSLCLLIAFSGTGAAQTVRSIDIVEVGIYRVEGTKQIPDSSLPLGFRTEGDFKLVERTTTIPARLGTTFQVKFRIVGSPLNGKVDIRKVVRFPAVGLKNPKTGEVLYRYELVLSKFIGATTYEGYGIDEAWEAVPGTWTIELWYQDRKLAEQSFNVVKQ